MKVPLVGEHEENMQWFEMTVFICYTIILTDVYIAIAYLWYPDIFRGHLSNIVHWLCHRSNQNVRSKEILCTKRNNLFSITTGMHVSARFAINLPDDQRCMLEGILETHSTLVEANSDL